MHRQHGSGHELRPTTRRNQARRPLIARALILNIWILGALIAACGGPAPAPEQPAAELAVHDARATLLGDTGAVYLRIDNPGSDADTLLRVETPQASAAEFHESLEEDGVVRMQAHPEGFEVPGGGALEFAPGGKHIMLIGPAPLAEGAETFPLTLYFERAGAVEIAVTVIEPGAEGGASTGTHHHGGMSH